jgi:predicted RNA binding protein YcfA (HicA-like mRNA interferase family)
MDKLPSIKSKTLFNFIRSVYKFELIDIEGSHHHLAHVDGRRATVSVHSSGRRKNVPPGTLRTIIRDDLKTTKDDFCRLYSQYKGEKGRKKKRK